MARFQAAKEELSFPKADVPRITGKGKKPKKVKKAKSKSSKMPMMKMGKAGAY